MKLRCAILDDYQKVALEVTDWSVLQDRVELESIHEHIQTEEELVRRLASYDILVIMRERTPFRASLLARLPRLKLLVTTGLRNASIDLAAAASHGVTVCGTPGHSEPPVELTWALLLGLARHVADEHQALRAGGPWQTTVGTDLYGKRLGLLGLGKIGSRVARIGQAFGMEVMAWSQNLTEDKAAEQGVMLAGSKEELLEGSDFVSIHVVLSDRTRGLVGEAELQRMRSTAYLINTSRAAIVDQTALAKALMNGWIAGAGLDVFDIEPLPQDHPYRSLPRVLTTPHLGYVTRRNYETFYRGAVEDIQAFLEGAPIRMLN
ncbi:D-2-hydroxyacid dehydrogenase family protein [Paenibacillus sp. GD4]|jgi:phosphoglycerate dehydrogenase-like enzyme|uniref:D-2-hydroxyacid dehydrogenase family protein n=1 Tax=Paenibacillus sp. GD4 TaxID=3068890 RepID=UPI00279657AD|nr:D-2-hydroxyacid dehydrogenase family protein [Paenibacillus sp. GD4]MDQ1913505.1 D-2-hydroxyacid dehydrogenase family protein [Paenibacillus sp. GD4]